MSRSIVFAVCALVACGSKKDKAAPTPAPEAGVAVAVDAAPKPSKPTEPPVPAVGEVDADAAAETIADYKEVRGLFKLTADDDAVPSKAQRAALSRIAGLDGAREARAIANDAGWGEAAASAWLGRMAKDAESNLKSIIRLPLSTCVGWGSATPSNYVAAGCFNAAAFFIKPAGETALVEKCDACWSGPDDKVDDCRDKRCSLVVEGHFTGEIEKTKGGPPGEPGPVAYEFEIAKARIAKKLPAPSLRLPGGHGAADGPAIKSGPKWGVMWASAFAIDDGYKGKAAEKATALAKAGFKGVEVIDSRRIPTLWCCSKAVVIARVANREEAAAKAAEVKAKGFDGIITREMY